MFGFKRAIGAVAVLFAAFAFGGAAQDETFDLRGPAPQKGQALVTVGTLKVTDADTVMKRGDDKVELKLNLTVSLEEHVAVLEVDGRTVMKCQTKIVKDRTETVGPDKKSTHIETSVLEKETLTSTRDGKKWKHAMVGNKPTDAQTKELAERGGPESDDALYPEGKVKVGHAWTADATAVSKVLGNALSDLKGKLDRKFVRVEDLDGERVAVIESAGKLTGKMKGNDGALTAELDLKITAWKSLKTGLAVRERFEGRVKLAGELKDADAKTELTMSGPISGESTTKLVEKK